MTTDRVAAPEQVRIGAHVEVVLISEQGERELLAVAIVREQFADLEKGLLGVQTPLAQAILGKQAGATVPYRMGDIRQVQIIAVRPAQTGALENTEAQRQAALQAALATVERTNAEMFAASYSGKWGDYAMSDNQDKE
jgi:hypothetical protein